MKFKLQSEFKPRGDQPKAIKALYKGLSIPKSQQVLFGATGTGKTFTIANIIEQYQRPALILAPNKTLVTQLYSELKTYFPENKVHYFVSYFDYYQPEAYKPQTDTYIEKDSKINEEIDRVRHAATASLLSRDDVIIVASVSCIFGLGDISAYKNLALKIKVGQSYRRDKLMRRLTDILYRRNDMVLKRSTFRVKGDVLDIHPASEETAYRIDFFGDEVERIRPFDATTAQFAKQQQELSIFPASHHVTRRERMRGIIKQIRQELRQRLLFFDKHGLLLEKQRLQQRVSYDLEMLGEVGFVKGVENYSRYFTRRQAGQQPPTLLDYFPDDYLMIIDESHLTIPQVRAMYAGDRSRKRVLVDYGFRLESALDNRPLNFEEFKRHLTRVIYVSATPGDWEVQRSLPAIEQIIRPTGLLDPEVEVRPTRGQVDDIIALIRERVTRKQRVLITTLTKKMAENLNDYLRNLKIKVQYLHSDVDTLKRHDILQDLRAGKYDVLVGINLLREGLDLPEVSLVAIFDADKEGFLRSERSLIQTIGRAARHNQGRVIMYADNMTDSMQRAINETARRREKQMKYNLEHGITPKTIVKALSSSLREDDSDKKPQLRPGDDIDRSLSRAQLRKQMIKHADRLEFEEAAKIRDLLDSKQDSQKSH